MADKDTYLEDFDEESFNDVARDEENALIQKKMGVYNSAWK